MDFVVVVVAVVVVVGSGGGGSGVVHTQLSKTGEEVCTRIDQAFSTNLL